MKEPVAKGEPLLGGLPLQHEAARLHPAGDPVEDLGEGEASGSRRRSSAGLYDAGPGGRPARGPSSHEAARPSRGTRWDGSSASTARPASRPEHGQQVAVGRGVPRPSSSLASKRPESSCTRPCARGRRRGARRGFPSPRLHRLAQRLHRLEAGAVVEVAAARAERRRCPRGPGRKAGPGDRRGARPWERAGAGRGALGLPPVPARRARRPGRRSRRGSRSRSGASCPQHWAQIARPWRDRPACPCAARQSGQRLSQCDLHHVLELGQHLVGGGEAQLLPRVEAAQQELVEGLGHARRRGCWAGAGPRPAAATGDARPSAGGRGRRPPRRGRRPRRAAFSGAR